MQESANLEGWKSLGIGAREVLDARLQDHKIVGVSLRGHVGVQVCWSVYASIRDCAKVMVCRSLTLLDFGCGGICLDGVA